jgi:sporulation protein YlmC with PRC-barrel domain
MFKPMSKPLLTAALLTAVGVASAQAQTASTPDGATPRDNPSTAPSIAMQMAAPSGADARKLIGRNIKDMHNATIGEIKSIHLDPGGKVDAVIALVGGFLGVGDREVLLEWRDLKVDNNGEVVHVNMTKDELKAKPPYTYKDKATHGTVFTDKGVWRDTTTAADTRADSVDRADHRNDTAAANQNAMTMRSTGDFNVAGQMSAEALVGKTVKNAVNESVGKINDVYLDANGAVKLVVVSVGGFLGVGSKDVGVPWSDLKFGRDGNAITVMTNWTKDSLKAMPDYKDERRLPAGNARSGG